MWGYVVFGCRKRERSLGFMAGGNGDSEEIDRERGEVVVFMYCVVSG